MTRNILICTALLSLLCACKTTPPKAKADKGTLYGTVTLVPREGVTPGSKGSGPYNDPRLADAEFVDYRRPGFAVVFFDGAPSPKGTIELSIAVKSRKARITPEYAAVGVGGKVTLTNPESETYTISCPKAQILQNLGSGEKLEIECKENGPLDIFVLGDDEAASTVFACPGPFSIASGSGDWELRNLNPASGKLTAWHPRFPAAIQQVQVEKGKTQEFELELRVENIQKQ